VLRVLVTGLLVLAGCESCNFTFGSITVGGMVTVVGDRPADLQLAACDGPDANNCQRPISVAGTAYMLGIENEGIFSCGYPKRWLVFTGTGCETVAFGVLSHDDTMAAQAEAAMLDLMTIDVTIICGGS
jgi:hypothetical protein